MPSDLLVISMSINPRKVTAVASRVAPGTAEEAAKALCLRQRFRTARFAGAAFRLHATGRGTPRRNEERRWERNVCCFCARCSELEGCWKGTLRCRCQCAGRGFGSELCCFLCSNAVFGVELSRAAGLQLEFLPKVSGSSSVKQ